MIDFPVKLRFIADQKQIQQAANKGGAVAAGGGKGKPSKTDEKQVDILGGISKGLAMILAVIGSVVTVLKPILDILSALLAIVSIMLIKPLLEIFTFLSAAIGGGKGKPSKTDEKQVNILEGIENFMSFLSGEISLGEYLGKVLDLMVAQLQQIPFVRVLMGVWNNIVVPAWKWLTEAIMNVWSNFILPAWQALSNFLGTIWNNYLAPAWEWLKNTLFDIWDDYLVPAWDWLSGKMFSLWDNYLLPAWDWLKGKFFGIWDHILKPAWEWFTDIGTKIWDGILKPAFNAVANAIKGAVDWIKNAGSNVGDFIGNTARGVGDFLSGRAFGGQIPEDGLYRMHAGEQVSRGNTVTNNSMNPNINITINGSADEGTVNMIASKLTQELNAYSRW